MGAGSAQIMLTDLRPPSLFVIWSMVYALLLIATTCNSALVKKIAVIGSGTGGLALAATLNRIGSGVKEITLFEERSSALQANAGGGVQLSGGAAILEKLGCSLSGSGVSLTRISSRNHLGDSIMNIDLAKAVRSHAPSLLSQDDSQAPMLYTVMREVLQQTLFDAATTRPLLAASPTVKVIENKRCNHITEMREGLKPSVTLHFADGDQSAGFDILVGADGVNSAVRQYVEGVSIKSDSSRVVRTGLRIAFCITPSVGRSHSRDGKGGEEGVLRQWFGDGVYALLGTYGGFTGVHRMLAVVYHADQSNPSTITAGTTGWDATNSDVPRTRQVQEMQRRLEAGKLGANAAILEVLQAASGEGGRFFDVAVKERLLPLRRWSSKSGRVVLLGDAAHPMSPFLGQGVNQALQDAYCLGTLIARANSLSYNESDLKTASHTLQDIARRYQSVRQPPTALLSLESSFLGQLETARGPVGGFLRDCFLRGMSATGLAGLAYVTSAIPRIE